MQVMESASLRSLYQLGPQQQGLLIREVSPTSCAAGVLQTDDVLLAADGVGISCDGEYYQSSITPLPAIVDMLGRITVSSCAVPCNCISIDSSLKDDSKSHLFAGTVPFREGERISFAHVIAQCYVGDVLSLEILRAGQQMTFSIPLSQPQLLVPPTLGSKAPQFVIAAGFCFVAFSIPFMYDFDPGDVSRKNLSFWRLMDLMEHGLPTVAGEEVEIKFKFKFLHFCSMPTALLLYKADLS